MLGVVILILQLFTRRRLSLLGMCLFPVLGACAVMMVDCLGRGLRTSFSGEARQVLGADLVVSFWGPPAANVEEAIAEQGARTCREAIFGSMLVSESGAHRVQVHSVNGAYPFYARSGVVPSISTWEQLKDAGGALYVERRLLESARLAIGDKVVVGGNSFTIREVVENIPGELTTVGRLDPAVFLRSADWKTGYGALVNTKIRVAAEEPAAIVRIQAMLSDSYGLNSLSIETPDRLLRRYDRYVDRFERFLRLCGICLLLLGLVGMAAVSLAVWDRELEPITTLLLLGARSTHIFTAQALLGIGLAGLSAGASAILAWWIMPFATEALQGVLPWKLDAPLEYVGIAPWSGLQSSVMLVWVLMLAASSVRAAPQHARRLDLIKRNNAILVACGFIAAVWLFTRTFLPSWRSIVIDVVMSTGLVATACLGCGLGIKVFHSFVAAHCGPWLRWVAANLEHKRLHSIVVIVSWASIMGVLCVIQISHSLLKKRMGLARGGPNVVITNLSLDDLDGAKAFLDSMQVKVTAVPLVQATIENVQFGNGRKGNNSLDGSSFLATYRDVVYPTETVIDGEFEDTSPTHSAIVPISIDERVAKKGLSVGDLVGWDISGVPVQTRVASIRSSDSARFYLDHPIVFPSGIIDKAPQRYMLLCESPSSVKAPLVVRKMAERWPRVLAFDVGLDERLIGELLDRALGVVRIAALGIAALGLSVSITLLIGIRRARREAYRVLRVIGVSGARVLFLNGAEALTIGTISAFIAVATCVVSVRWVCVHVLEVQPGSGMWSILVLFIFWTLICSSAMGALGYLAQYAFEPKDRNAQNRSIE
ncbi:hypothetical protein DB347_18010 [Opitutaceae bacterium EW11]|nr:hypothetical protein DB347_18010 [Opitutaceae bacterium EW11]